MLVLSDEDALRVIRRGLAYWVKWFPQEFEATKRYAERRRQAQVNTHGVEGLSRDGNLLAWAFCPGTVHTFMSRTFGPNWDVDKRLLNLFYSEFRLGCINPNTKANRDRERNLSAVD